HTAPPVAYSRAAHPPHLPSSPTRRSSDLPSPGHTPHHPHPEPVPSPPRRRNESEGTDGRNTGTHAGRRAPHPHRRGHPPAPPKPGPPARGNFAPPLPPLSGKCGTSPSHRRRLPPTDGPPPRRSRGFPLRSKPLGPRGVSPSSHRPPSEPGASDTGPQVIGQGASPSKPPSGPDPRVREGGG